MDSAIIIPTHDPLAEKKMFLKIYSLFNSIDIIIERATEKNRLSMAFSEWYTEPCSVKYAPITKPRQYMKMIWPSFIISSF